MKYAPRSSHIRANVVLCAFGVFFSVSPWLLQFYDAVRARNNAIVVGLLTVLFATTDIGLMGVSERRQSRKRVILGFSAAHIAVGAWTILSPMLLGFYRRGDAIFTTVAVGIAVVLTSLYSIYGPSKDQRREHAKRALHHS